MTIRNKLSIQFTIIVASIILVTFLAILKASSDYRISEFNGRLEQKAIQTARLFLDIEEVDSVLLKKIDDPSTGSVIDERLTILSPSGQTLYTTDPSNELGISENEIKELEKDTITTYVNGDLEIVGLKYISSDEPYIIFIGGFDKYGKRKIQNLQFTLLLTWILCVLVAAYAGWLFAGRALKPVTNIIKEVDQINDKNLESRIFEGNGRDELARLANTFNNILNRVENSIRLEKNFLANASHELRNPLAAITSQIEVCLLSDRSSEEYQRILKSVLEDIKSLNLLGHQLLLLTRIEAGFTKDRFTIERIDQLIFDACENSNRASDLIRIEFQLMENIEEDDKWKLRCSKELILSAFQNILDNAKKFDATELIIEHHFEDGYHVISFVDNGTGIESSDLKRLFDPFYRSQNSAEKKGYGIGLSLVHRIVELHHGSISVDSELGVGTRFLLKIPK